MAQKIEAHTSTGKKVGSTRRPARLPTGSAAFSLASDAFAQLHAMTPGPYRSREYARLSARARRNEMSRPGVAALLSFIIPGVGQIYNGDILRGLFWLVITPGFWVGSGGLLGWVCHVIAAATAYSRGGMKEQQRLGMPVRM
jgi:TM2 domain-containing membrane protein YozV